jgi:transcriptional regulator GlxA family with amidase domain
MTSYCRFLPMTVMRIRNRKAKGEMRRVVLLAFEGVQMLDLAGPAQVFASANDLEAGRYDIRVVSRAGGPVATSSGLAFATEPLATVAERPVHTLILPGGDQGVRNALADPALMAWVTRMAERADRACSVCSGAFLLAATGLADGRRVATHWQAARLLQQAHPALSVDPEAIYVEDGKVWSSAGVTTGIDLALALVERDHGRDTAMRIARRLVVYMRRPGHQSQFSAALQGQSVADDRVAQLIAWMREHLAEDLGIERLAGRAAMCPRTFHRAFTAATGETPARFVETLRLDAAREQLANPALSVERVAHLAGFGRAERLSKSFRRRLGLTPAAYRKLHAVAA